MHGITLDDLLKVCPEESRIGTSSAGNIDKTGVVYHVITTSWRKKWLFDAELASYRQDLLCELCLKRGITILFSATMPTHTHEVFITPSWEDLSAVMRTLNSNIAKYVKRHMPDRMKGRRSIFSPDPVYIMVTDIEFLFYLGKYIFGNCQHLKDEGKNVPDSCFWMFEKGYFPEPYNAAAYTTLFDISPTDLLELYRTKTNSEIRTLAAIKFASWTKSDNAALFIRPATDSNSKSMSA